MAYTVTPNTRLRFTDEREYRRVVHALANPDGITETHPLPFAPSGRDVVDLCECQRPKGAYTVTLADALKALSTARQEARKVRRRRARS